MNNRYCRTGSVHSWILPSEPLITRIKCENCKTADEHHQALLQAKERLEEEEERKQEQARELRLQEKEFKRVEERKGSAADALKSQMAGLNIKHGGDTSRSRRTQSDAMDDVD